jgi:hypothetical protein
MLLLLQAVQVVGYQSTPLQQLLSSSWHWSVLHTDAAFVALFG